MIRPQGPYILKVIQCVENTESYLKVIGKIIAVGGLWTDHIFAQIKLRVTANGRNAIAKIDKQMSAMPRWRGLNHFDAVMNITFNDGSKNEDIAKMMFFAAHNVLTDAPGISLLQCAQSFLELSMYVSLEVHTTETLAAGKRELLIFDERIKEYIEICKDTEYGDKSWNFPKMHSHWHVFDDIKNKGATRNFGTKISESMHGPIRQMYHRLTNFKNVTPQLIKHDHRRVVGIFIREQLDILDAVDDSDDTDSEILSNITIGSKLRPIAFSVLEEKMFTYGYGLPDGKPIRFDKNNTIVPFQFLKVHYQHLGDWKSTADYLRCNPMFHGQSRYDGAVVKTTDGHMLPAKGPTYLDNTYLWNIAKMTVTVPASVGFGYQAIGDPWSHPGQTRLQMSVDCVVVTIDHVGPLELPIPSNGLPRLCRGSAAACGIGTALEGNAGTSKGLGRQCRHCQRRWNGIGRAQPWKAIYVFPTRGIPAGLLMN
ncbi:hypothetical protein K438DRAFT_1785549 [Mycena galopus ATCC 62051]|nr:hypothetical protein K438DRAFT_1785549 [Mycena galopus ATCC 62051]